MQVEISHNKLPDGYRVICKVTLEGAEVTRVSITQVRLHLQPDARDVARLEKDLFVPPHCQSFRALHDFQVAEGIHQIWVTAKTSDELMRTAADVTAATL